VIEFSPDVSHETFGSHQDFGEQLASSVKNNKSCYLKPTEWNLTTFHSFLYQPGFNHPGFQPLGLQMTDVQHHDISLKSPQTLVIPELNALRPTAKRKWIIIFVVPASVGASFEVQKFEDGAKHWEPKMAQYILQLQEEEVWKVI